MLTSRNRGGILKVVVEAYAKCDKRLWKKSKLIEKSCWQTRGAVVWYQSCRRERQQQKARNMPAIFLKDSNEFYWIPCRRRMPGIGPWQMNSNATLKIPERDGSRKDGFRLPGKLRFQKNKERDGNHNPDNSSQIRTGWENFWTWEFDPGSGWTLAACLTHASRTGLFNGSFRTEGK